MKQTFGAKNILKLITQNNKRISALFFVVVSK